MFLTKPQY